ncbi:hypothetical protein ATDW_01180 [Asticcacaulis sp. DW145]|nr:hypothetical protein ATDW_01180 [Asticcacaulis sp. DW145]
MSLLAFVFAILKIVTCWQFPEFSPISVITARETGYANSSVCVSIMDRSVIKQLSITIDNRSKQVWAKRVICCPLNKKLLSRNYSSLLMVLGIWPKIILEVSVFYDKARANEKNIGVSFSKIYHSHVAGQRDVWPKFVKLAGIKPKARSMSRDVFLSRQINGLNGRFGTLVGLPSGPRGSSQGKHKRDEVDKPKPIVTSGAFSCEPLRAKIAFGALYVLTFSFCAGCFIGIGLIFNGDFKARFWRLFFGGVILAISLWGLLLLTVPNEIVGEVFWL